MKNINIFLASSKELAEMRSIFDLFFKRKNDYLIKQDVFLKVTLWENFSNSVSQTRLQNEYNNAIYQSDLFVSIFDTVAGKYTIEEFKYAYDSFKKNGRPLVFTYFKLKPEQEQNSLIDFKNNLKDLGHYITMYENEQDLLLQFSEELNRFLSGTGIRNQEKENKETIRKIVQEGKNFYIEKNEGTININLS